MLAEKALLGSFIKANHLLKDTTIKSNQFEDVRNQALFKIMKKLNDNKKSIDIISLTTTTNIEPLGGVSYLNELISYANPSKFDEYEQLIIDSWKEREKRNILAIANQEDWEISRVISALDEINEVRIEDHASISDTLAEIFDAPWREEEIKKGASTGLKKLDLMTNGFQDSEVTIIAARPSMGKTDIVLHFAKQAGWQGYLPILFSLEMPKRSITDRLIASTGQFNRMKMRNPFKDLSEGQKSRWPEVIGKLSKTNIQIFDSAGQSISEMRAKTRKLIHEFPNLKPIIFIDYLTLIRSAEFYGGNAHLQVTEISKNLKAMAKEFNIPVVCLAQLSRSVEQRADKRPIMSDIRESGSVEQDADLIMFLYREKYYDKNSTNDILEIIVSKNRNGPVGTVFTKYNEFTGVVSDADN